MSISRFVFGKRLELKVRTDAPVGEGAVLSGVASVEAEMERAARRSLRDGEARYWNVGGSSFGNGIGYIQAPRSSLIGVFLSDSILSSSTPPDVNYLRGAQELEVLRPLLQQPFFIGAGKTVGGSVRTVVVPSGATRLFLGITDSTVGSYSGSFTVTVSALAVTAIPGNPARVYGVMQLGLAGQPDGTKYNGDSAPLNSPAPRRQERRSPWFRRVRRREVRPPYSFLQKRTAAARRPSDR
ncbi:MAG: hypothetical protein HY820_06880 [Acidobacteria bacterium]|nr:hypothetical protein [Acidobacteriota bacterium]